jgi:hypothetical protein
MSQVTRTAQPQPQQQQQQPSETITKKKLGKNLNRLTRPPSPPVASTAKVNTASKNGLLLLSTKRPAAGGNVASSSGGILSNKSSNIASKPLPSLGLQYESNTSMNDALLGAVVGASRAEAQHQPDAWGVADKINKNGNLNAEGVVPPSNQTQQHIPNGDHGQDAVNTYNAAPDVNWDDYGGRNHSRDLHDNGQDSRGEIMPKERLWGENDSRRISQETASRAREIDNSKFSSQNQETASALANESMVLQKPSLGPEKLNHSQSLPDEHAPRSPMMNPANERANPRTLYDPGTKSFSSLVGGPASKDEKEPIVPTPEHSRNGRALSAGAYSPDPSALNDARDPKYSRQPVIQLSSYETRDRGERGASAGPRMLFDPKSGSMVAVPSRDDSAAGARGRKDRGKKGRRDKDSKADSKTDSNENGRTGRKGKQKRDDAPQRGRGGDHVTTPSKADAKKGRSANNRKLPRTRGVLYSRDNKGNLYSVDGCDGDLGYGAHSVPGGRTKNPDAYAKYTEEQKQESKDEVDFYHGHSLETSYEKDTSDQDQGQFVALQTGFNVQEPVKLDWVKPNEKISLVTGIDDSPTLQATAKEWAPSAAAVAAAAAALEREKEVLSSPVHGHDDDDDDDDDAPVSTNMSREQDSNPCLFLIFVLQFGLGFDPTLNMDSVIQSPSSEPASGFDAVNLAALSLEPSALQSTAKSNHIFAFESGATWGSSNTSGSNDWGIPSAGNAFSSDEPNTSVIPSTFLSLSSGGTWGGVPGLGGTSLGNSSLGGEHNRSNGE